MAERAVVAALVAALLDGPWTDGPAQERVRRAVGLPRARWPHRLVLDVLDVLAAFPSPPRDDPDALGRAVAAHPSSARAAAAARDRGRPLRVAHLATATTRAGRSRHPVPRLDTTAELAAFLDVTPEELDWFADLRGLQVRTPGPDGPLHHHRSRWVPERGAPRLLETPEPRLRELQRRVLHELLDPVVPHDAAHGFVPGRSALTGRASTRGPPSSSTSTSPRSSPPSTAAASGASSAPWATRWPWRRRWPGSPPTAPRGRCCGPCPVVAPPTSGPRCGRGWRPRTWRMGRRRHRPWRTWPPPGWTPASPGSPARWGPSTPATPTTSSSPADPSWPRGPGTRRTVTGLVVDERPAVPRDELDRLRAALHQCVARGAEGLARVDHPDPRAHLAGRVAWVASVDPVRVRRVPALHDRIAW